MRSEGLVHEPKATGKKLRKTPAKTRRMTFIRAVAQERNRLAHAMNGNTSGSEAGSCGFKLLRETWLLHANLFAGLSFLRAIAFLSHSRFSERGRGAAVKK